jgi:UDP-N-acetylmuramoyl-L-alanyl-D-glutamate--2,6-diaminopimelate ligase
MTIIDQIVSGIGNLGFNPLSSGYTGPSLDERVRVEEDRRTAIYEAIALAHAADVVIIAGKGHESYQEIGHAKLPFSDVAVATEALRRERRRNDRTTEPRAC